MLPWANKSPCAASPHPASQSSLRACRTVPQNPPASPAPHETKAQRQPPHKQTSVIPRHVLESIAYLRNLCELCAPPSVPSVLIPNPFSTAPPKSPRAKDTASNDKSFASPSQNPL